MESERNFHADGLVREENKKEEDFVFILRFSLLLCFFSYFLTCFAKEIIKYIIKNHLEPTSEVQTKGNSVI